MRRELERARDTSERLLKGFRTRIRRQGLARFVLSRAGLSPSSISRTIWVTYAALALVLIILFAFAALEYAQVASLGHRNAELTSEVESYSNQVSISVYSRGVNASAGNASLGLIQTWQMHLTKLEDLDPASAIQDYTANATVNFWGSGFGNQTANFIGTDQIESVLDVFFQNASSTSLPGEMTRLAPRSWQIAVQSLNPIELPDGSDLIKSNLSFSGSSDLFGAFNGTASTTTQFSYQSGIWLITQEEWDFTSFNLQYNPPNGI
jgi:hypothetical protein